MSFSISPVGVYTTVSRHGYSTGGSVVRRAARSSTYGFENFRGLQPVVPSGRTLAAALSSLTQQVSSLKSDIDALAIPSGAASGSLRSVSVSDTAKASAQVRSGASLRSYSLDIGSLAGAKTLQSDVLSAGDTTELDSGTHAFTLSVDETAYEISIDVDSSDTNKDILDKIARAVNSAGAGVEASVEEASRKVYSTLSDNLFEDVVYLSISASSSGADTDFSLADSGSGTIIDDLNLDTIVSRAASAAYTIDGTSGSSSTNTLSADSGLLTIELLDTTGERVTIAVDRALEPVMLAISDIVSGYNDLIAWLDDNREYIDPSLQSDLSAELQSRARDLQAVGLGVSAAGLIQINAGFGSALQNNPSLVHDTLVGSEGVLSSISATFTDILENGARDYAAPSALSSVSAGFSIYA